MLRYLPLLSALMLVTLTSSAWAFQRLGTPVTKLTPNSLEGSIGYGLKCSLSGSHLAVPARDMHRGEGGAVHFYRRTSRGWSLEQIVTPPVCYPDSWDPHPPCGFGLSVDLHEDRALIGSLGGDLPGGGLIGIVYVYEWNGSFWEYTQAIRSPVVPGELGIGFGIALGQSSGTIAIGAQLYPLPDGQLAGAVFLYERDHAGLWQLSETLLPAPYPPAMADLFGASLALGENTLVVGAPVSVGRVHIYRRREGSLWHHVQTVASPSPGSEDHFGGTVALDPVTETIVVGDSQAATAFSPRPGRFHIYERRSLEGVWELQGTFEATEPWANSSDNDRFGSAISAYGGQIVVGGGRTLFEGDKTGSAELFEKKMGNWQRTRRYVLREPSAGMGLAVATDQRTTVVTAETWNKTFGGTGAAFVYEESFGTPGCRQPSPAPTLSLLGTEGSSGEHFLLAVHGVPKGSWGFFAYGHPGQPAPFGPNAEICMSNGYRVLPNPVFGSFSIYRPVPTSVSTPFTGRIAFQFFFTPGSAKGRRLASTSLSHRFR